jgi:hypothetical protein
MQLYMSTQVHIGIGVDIPYENLLVLLKLLIPLII